MATTAEALTVHGHRAAADADRVPEQHRRPTRPRATAIGASFVVSLALVAAVLGPAGGWAYYTRPVGIRAYSPAHARLRPSGSIGLSLGVAGLALMLVPYVYALRKRSRLLARAGRMDRWLDVHIFSGLVGPVAITLHTSMKFNGIVAVAYWSMITVTVSGIVGRYLYGRIPRTIRGVEMTYEEILARAAALKNELATTGLAPALIGRLEQIEKASLPHAGAASIRGYLAEPLIYWWRLRGLGREMQAAGAPPALVSEALRLASDRASLLRRLASLAKTKQLFAAWHVFHLPLAIVVLAVVAVHVAVALYLGYLVIIGG
jgi:hypothetical protein